MSIKDYQPTPEQVEGIRKEREIQLERCQRVLERWRIKQEEKRKPKKK